jgi:two-component system sensor histidine kinase CpxA
MGRRRDEIANLGKDFDRMTEQVECLIESQKRLLRDISHELRSPLSRLTIALELARQKSPDTITGPLDRIGLETERLNDLIGQLLTLTKLETGTARPEEPMDLGQLLKKIALDAGFEAQTRNVSVFLDAPETFPYSGHPETLYRAIENVVRNAVRYTRENARVFITLDTPDQDGSHVRITVNDEGEGVPEKDLPHLFKAFYRVADSRDRKTGGMGLGLSIAERAIHFHHGTIMAENIQGSGFSITITLPVTTFPKK